jgi:uncharacterized Tic20 family protein
MSADLPPLPPPTPADSDGKIWAVLAHLSGFIGLPFILPLIIYLVKRNESTFVAENAREALNFHITLFLAFIVCAILVMVLVGFFLAAILAIGSLILSIMAAIRAGEGGVYRYPCTLRLI